MAELLIAGARLLDPASGMDGSCQRPAIGRDDRRLASGVHLHQHERIRSAQHLHEVFEAVARSRIAVRLKCEQHAAPRKCAPRRGKRRRHFRGMVPIVIDEPASSAAWKRHLAVLLKAPSHPFETCEGRCDFFRRDPDFQAHCDCSQCVLHVVHAG